MYIVKEHIILFFPLEWNCVIPRSHLSLIVVRIKILLAIKFYTHSWQIWLNILIAPFLNLNLKKYAERCAGEEVNSAIFKLLLIFR